MGFHPEYLAMLRPAQSGPRQHPLLLVSSTSMSDKVGKCTVSLGETTLSELDRRCKRNASSRSYEVRIAIRDTMPDPNREIAQAILRSRRFAQPAGDEGDAELELTQILEKYR